MFLKISRSRGGGGGLHLKKTTWSSKMGGEEFTHSLLRLGFELTQPNAQPRRAQSGRGGKRTQRPPAPRESGARKPSLEASGPEAK